MPKTSVGTSPATLSSTSVPATRQRRTGSLTTAAIRGTVPV